jgi:hypothetical protein
MIHALNKALISKVLVVASHMTASSGVAGRYDGPPRRYLWSKSTASRVSGDKPNVEAAYFGER